MATVEPRTSSVAMRVSSRAAELAVVVASGELVAQEALAELVVQVAQEALAELVVQVAPEALAELAGLVVQVAQEALVGPVELDVRAALVRLVVQVVELELNRVEGPELVIAQVEALPERDPVAVPLRTRSAIAAHHRGLVPVPKRVVDLAAAAETKREPAAAEAARAWAAAV